VIRRIHAVVRLAAAALAAVCLAAAAPVPPPPGRTEAGFDTVPGAVRALLHPTTALLPAFPNESPEALDPGRWAPSVRDSDRVCVLELRTYVRGTPVTLSDIRQRKPGQSLSARYLCGSRTWRGPRYAGPFYVWDGHNALVERSYRVTDGARYREDLYQYRGNGLVWAYRHRERNEDQSGPFFMLDEYYDPDGKLAGFSIERTTPDSLALRWRRGAVVEDEAFRKWTGEFR
jgi:hypothetical protein